MTKSPERARSLAIGYRFIFFCLLGVFILSFFDDPSLSEVVVATVLYLVVLGGIFFWGFTSRGRRHLAEQPEEMPKTWRGRFFYVGITAVAVCVLLANGYAFSEDSELSTFVLFPGFMVLVFFTTQFAYKLDAKWSGEKSSHQYPAH